MSRDISAEVEELATKQLRGRMGVKKELRKLPTLIREQERVLRLASGRYESQIGLLAVTDQRVIFLAEAMMKSRHEDFDFHKVSSVQTDKGMVMGSVTITVSGNRATIDNMQKADAEQIGTLVRDRINRPAETVVATHAPAAPAAGMDKVTMLKELADLRDQGILTPAEFDQEKAKILGG